MKILVTGGAGFLGSHLCERLLKDGHSVLCLDDLSTGSMKNIAHLMGDRFRLQVWDVAEPYWTEERFGRIYNLACPASPKNYQADPVKTMCTNVIGVINMLDIAKNCGARFLQSSTSEVYGDAVEHPQREDYWGNVNTIGPRACYDEGKRSAETLCFDYKRMYGVKVRVPRIFNTYGPRMDSGDGRVIPNFVNQALRGEALTIHGDGLQTRSFCYVDDLINGLVMLMESNIDVPVNIGNPEEITMYELANRVNEMVGKSKIKTLPLPQDDPKQRCPDISRALRMGWSPKTALVDGLQKTIEYFSEKAAAAA